MGCLGGILGCLEAVLGVLGRYFGEGEAPWIVLGRFGGLVGGFVGRLGAL